MKKIISILILFISLNVSAQKPKADVYRYSKITTTERDLLSPELTNIWFIYNQTNQQFEFFNGVSWTAVDTNTQLTKTEIDALGLDLDGIADSTTRKALTTGAQTIEGDKTFENSVEFRDNLYLNGQANIVDVLDIEAQNFIGNGSQLTNLPIPTKAQIDALGINATHLGGVASANNYHTTNANLSTVDWNAKNLIASGSATFGGNVAANNFIGNGAQLTNVNADTVDGLHGSQFLRNDTTSEFNGPLLHIVNALSWKVSYSDSALQRVDARTDDTNKARLYWYGQSAVDNTSFRSAWYDGSNYINIDAVNGGVVFNGNLTAKQLILNSITELTTTNGSMYNSSANNYTYIQGSTAGLLLYSNGNRSSGSSLLLKSDKTISLTQENVSVLSFDTSKNAVFGGSVTATNFIGNWNGKTLANFNAKYDSSNFGKTQIDALGINATHLGGIASANNYHTTNANLSTVDWNAKNLIASGTGTFGSTIQATGFKTATGTGTKLFLDNGTTKNLSDFVTVPTVVNLTSSINFPEASSISNSYYIANSTSIINLVVQPDSVVNKPIGFTVHIANKNTGLFVFTNDDDVTWINNGTSDLAYGENRKIVKIAADTWMVFN